MAVVTVSHRHLVILGLAATLACGGRQSGGPVEPAPAAADATVEAFLAAINANDLDRMAQLWGDVEGPSTRSRRMSRDERRQRLIIMQRLLRSDSRRLTVTDASQPGRRVVAAELMQGTRRFTVSFVCVEARTGGWLVREIPNLDVAVPSAGPRPRTTP